MSKLAGMMNEIAGNQRFFAVGRYAYAHMTCRMALTGNQSHFVTNNVVRLDEIDKPSIEYRRERLRSDDLLSTRMVFQPI